MSLELPRITGANTTHSSPAVRAPAAIPAAAQASSAGSSSHERQGQQQSESGQQNPPPGPGYVLMQRFLVAGDSIQGGHVKFPPNPVQLSLGLLTGSRTGVVAVDVDGDGISIEPPTRLDRRV